MPSLDAWHAARWKQWKQADPGSPPIDLESLPGDGHMEGNKLESMVLGCYKLGIGCL